MKYTRSNVRNVFIVDALLIALRYLVYLLLSQIAELANTFTVAKLIYTTRSVADSVIGVIIIFLPVITAAFHGKFTVNKSTVKHMVNASLIAFILSVMTYILLVSHLYENSQDNITNYLIYLHEDKFWIKRVFIGFTVENAINALVKGSMLLVELYLFQSIQVVLLS